MNPVRGSDFSIDLSRSGPVFHDAGQAASPAADVAAKVAAFARSTAASLAALEAELTVALVIAPFAMAVLAALGAFAA